MACAPQELWTRLPQTADRIERQLANCNPTTFLLHLHEFQTQLQTRDPPQEIFHGFLEILLQRDYTRMYFTREKAHSNDRVFQHLNKIFQAMMKLAVERLNHGLEHTSIKILRQVLDETQMYYTSINRIASLQSKDLLSRRPNQENEGRDEPQEAHEPQVSIERNLDYFMQALKGCDQVLEALSMSQETLGTPEETTGKWTFETLSLVVELFSQVTRLTRVSPKIKAKFTQVLRTIIYQIPSASFGTEAFVHLIHHFENFLASTEAPENDQLLHTLRLAGAYQYLVSQSLEKRITGILEIVQLVQQIHQEYPRQEPQESVQPECKWLVDWIQQQQIVEHCLGPNVHSEILKRMAPLLQFLALHNQLQKSQVGCLWRLYFGDEKHEFLATDTLDLILDVLPTCHASLLSHWFNLFQQFPAQDDIFEATNIYLFAQIAKASDKTLQNEMLNWLWTTIQSAASSEEKNNVDDAIACICHLLQFLNESTSLLWMLKQCSTNLQNQEARDVSLNCLTQLFCFRSELSGLSSTYDEFLQQTELGAILLTELHAFKKAETPEKAYEDGIRRRLRCLQAICLNTEIAVFDSEMAERLWEECIVGAQTQTERDYCFMWFEMGRKEKIYVPLDVAVMLLLNKFNLQDPASPALPSPSSKSHVILPPSSLTTQGYQCFHQLFRSINLKLGYLEQHSGIPIADFSHALNASAEAVEPDAVDSITHELIGMTQLWQIALLSCRDNVVHQAMEDLLKYNIQAIGSSLESEFMETCFNYLQHAHTQLSTQPDPSVLEILSRSIVLINGYIDVVYASTSASSGETLSCLSNDPNWFDCLMNLLELKDNRLKLRVWQLIEKLNVNVEILRELEEAPTAKTLLQSFPLATESLASLLYHVHVFQTHLLPYASFEWKMEFIQSQGYERLLQIVSAWEWSENPLEWICFTKLLKVLTEFITCEDEAMEIESKLHFPVVLGQLMEVGWTLSWASAGQSPLHQQDHFPREDPSPEAPAPVQHCPSIESFMHTLNSFDSASIPSECLTSLSAFCLHLMDKYPREFQQQLESNGCKVRQWLNGVSLICSWKETRQAVKTQVKQSRRVLPLFVDLFKQNISSSDCLLSCDSTQFFSILHASFRSTCSFVVSSASSSSTQVHVSREFVEKLLQVILHRDIPFYSSTHSNQLQLASACCTIFQLLLRQPNGDDFARICFEYEELNVMEYLLSKGVYGYDHPSTLTVFQDLRTGIVGFLTELFKWNETDEWEHLLPLLQQFKAISLFRELNVANTSNRIYLEYWNYNPMDEVRPKDLEFVGLYNPGCICYMNALLQQLYFVSRFSATILQLPHDIENTSEDLVDEIQHLQTVFANLKLSSKRAYDPTRFCLSHKDIDGNPTDLQLQMDADEFFCLLMDRIETVMAKADSQLIQKELFNGQLVNQIITDQGNVSERNESFYAISLDIKNQTSILDSLAMYVKGEKLQGDNAYYCEQLQTKVSALKRVCIDTLPHVLVLHLKRFEFNYDTMTKEKVNDYIAFPQHLNMSPYTKEALMHSSDDAPGEALYELVGVVIHTGTSDTGHYYSFIKERQTSNQWYEFNDQVVQPFDFDNLAEECFGGDEEVQEWDPQSSEYVTFTREKQRNAYMLVYERQFSKVSEVPQTTTAAEKVVLEENQDFQSLVDVFDPEYPRLVDAAARGMGGTPEMIELVSAYLFDILAFADPKLRKTWQLKLTNELCDALDLEGSLWIVAQPLQVKSCEWLANLLIACQDNTTRRCYARVLETCIEQFSLVKKARISSDARALLQSFTTTFTALLDPLQHCWRHQRQFVQVLDVFVEFILTNDQTWGLVNHLVVEARVIERIVEYLQHIACSPSITRDKPVDFYKASFTQLTASLLKILQHLLIPSSDETEEEEDDDTYGLFRQLNPIHHDPCAALINKVWLQQMLASNSFTKETAEILAILSRNAPSVSDFINTESLNAIEHDQFSVSDTCLEFLIPLLELKDQYQLRRIDALLNPESGLLEAAKFHQQDHPELTLEIIRLLLRLTQGALEEPSRRSTALRTYLTQKSFWRDVTWIVSFLSETRQEMLTEYVEIFDQFQLFEEQESSGSG